MQDDRIHWNGQPIAVVLAETQEQADHAASLIRATYEAEEPLTSFAEAKAKGTKPGMFMGEPLHDEIGDAEAALAARRDQRRLDLSHAAPQPQCDRAPRRHRRVAGRHADRPRRLAAGRAHRMVDRAGVRHRRGHRCVVTSPFVGGGFGGKCLWQHQVLAAAASKLAGRPVRLVAVARGRLPRGRRAHARPSSASRSAPSATASSPR